MLKKVIVILCMLGLISFSCSLLKKTETKENPTAETEQSPVKEEKLPTKTYTFNTENLSDECLEKDEMLCAVENAVKCTIDMNRKECRQLDLPQFIFMTEQTIERPTEISYKFINKKVLSNNTVEIHTTSACNGQWFGLCQGTIIYILAPTENESTQRWHVKDIYAIE